MIYHPDFSQSFTTPDGSRILEVLGRVKTQDETVSVARIEMPVGGGQPLRQNGFREVLIVIRGSCTVAVPTGSVSLVAGDVLDLPAGTPYAEQGGPDGCSCWAICWPAFSPQLVTWL